MVWVEFGFGFGLGWVRVGLDFGWFGLSLGWVWVDCVKSSIWVKFGSFECSSETQILSPAPMCATGNAGFSHKSF